MGLLGKKQMEQLTGFTTTLVAYGVASFVGLVYFTDWKIIATYIPFYNGKFKTNKPAADAGPCD